METGKQIFMSSNTKIPSAVKVKDKLLLGDPVVKKKR